MKENIYEISSAPHFHENVSVKSVMWQVVIALIPALIFSIYFFGFISLFLTIIAIAAAILSEAAIQKFRKVPLTITDGSAVITGILVAYNVPSTAPWWIVAIGSIFAIAIGKQAFGGLGHNPLNPALLARAFLVASWPNYMTAGFVSTKLGSINGINVQNFSGKVANLITGATPLSLLKSLKNPDFIATLGDNLEQGKLIGETIYSNLIGYKALQNLFWGNVGGVLGETSVIALLIGAAYLAYKHIIEWRIPTFYISTVFILTYIFGGNNGLFSASVLVSFFHIFSGGLILGAFFMATDMVSSPITKTGRILFGIGCGIITVLIRLKGGYPEGVSYSILIMNLFVPLLDKLCVPKFFGAKK